MSTVKTLYNRLVDSCKTLNLDHSLKGVVDRIPLDSGNKVMPPTYKDKQHHQEFRYIDGILTKIVVLDSISSMANRLEMAVYERYCENLFPTPNIEIIFSKTDMSLSVFEIPHRLFGRHIITSSTDKGEKFINTEWGKEILSGNDERIQKTILKLCPQIFVFGGWASTMAQCRFKFPRSYKGEIIGKFLADTDKSSSVMDPLNISKNIPMYKEDDNTNFRLTPPNKKSKSLKASEMNLGNIVPTLTKCGAIIEWAKEDFELNLCVLRKIRIDDNFDHLIRAYIAAWSIYAHSISSKNSFFRSGCNLMPLKSTNTYSWITLGEKAEIEMNEEDVHNLYLMALEPIENKFIDTKFNLRLMASSSLEEAMLQSGNRDNGEGEE